MTPEQEQKLNRAIEMLERMDGMFRNPAQIDPQYASTIKAIVGAVTLNSLADVDTSGVNNGQVIKYNSTTQKWVPANDIDT